MCSTGRTEAVSPCLPLSGRLLEVHCLVIDATIAQRKKGEENGLGCCHRWSHREAAANQICDSLAARLFVHRIQVKRICLTFIMLARKSARQCPVSSSEIVFAFEVAS